MKKEILLLLIIASFFSCSNNVEFNNPALQGKKDGEIWKATSYRAHVDADGKLTITGTSNDSDNLTLRVTSTELATYELGNTTPEATYNDGANTLYSTNNSPDPSVSLYEPDGQIEIYEYDSANKFVSGRYNFNAYNVSGLKTVNFNQGDFYRVPITGEAIASSCETATQLATNAQTVYNSTAATDPNYSSACNSYKDALTNKINACGDTDGSIQTLIDNLGDCIANPNDACATATQNASSAETTYNGVANTDAQYPTVCNDYKTALTNKITQCGDDDGSIQAIIDGLGDCSISAPSNPTGVISTDVGTANRTFETNMAVVTSGTTLQVSADDDIPPAGTKISFDVEQNATGTDIISNFKITIGTTVYTPGTGFTSEITLNNGTDIDGTFSGPVETASAPDLQLNNGVIDVAY